MTSLSATKDFMTGRLKKFYGDYYTRIIVALHYFSNAFNKFYYENLNLL